MAIDMKPKVILICGPQGSGKSSASNALAEKGWSQIGFADPIRSMLYGLGVKDRFLRRDATQEEKRTPLAILGGKSVRYALQTLGTEWGRGMMGEDLWANHAMERVLASHGKYFVIDDLRMPNELAVFERARDEGKIDLWIVRIVPCEGWRVSPEISDRHETEAHFGSFEVHDQVVNDKTDMTLEQWQTWFIWFITNRFSEMPPTEPCFNCEDTGMDPDLKHLPCPCCDVGKLKKIEMFQAKK